MNTQEVKKPVTGMSNGSQMRISPEEQRIIKATFADKPDLLKLLRKIFLPEIDPSAPATQVIDLWMTLENSDKSLEEQLINLKARNKVITHVDQQLLTLELMSKMNTPTPEEIAEQTKKNSNK